MAGMKNDYFRSQLRLSEDLYEQLKEAAARNGRSLNAEIVARLEASFEPPLRAVMEELLEAQTERILGEIRRCGGNE